MKTFVFYWLDGTVEESSAGNVVDAFTKLGYSAGAMAALDYWEEKKEGK